MSRQDGQIESRERCWGAETHLGQCLFTFWVSMQAQKDYNESQRLSSQKMHGFNSLRILSGKKIGVQFLGVQCLCLVVISFTCPRIVRKQSAWRKVSLCFISIIKNQCRSFLEEANLGSNFIKRWGNEDAELSYSLINKFFFMKAMSTIWQNRKNMQV